MIVAGSVGEVYDEKRPCYFRCDDTIADHGDLRLDYEKIIYKIIVDLHGTQCAFVKGMLVQEAVIICWNLHLSDRNAISAAKEFVQGVLSTVEKHVIVLEDCSRRDIGNIVS